MHNALEGARCRVGRLRRGETPFIAGDPSRPEQERLAALKKAFFTPGHDPRPWLDGWYPQALVAQSAAVTATDVAPYRFGGRGPVLEIIPSLAPFKPTELWEDLREKAGERVTTAIVEDAAHARFPKQPQRVATELHRWYLRLR